MAYKQHFIEWFSGKQLPSYWTTRNHVGTATFRMSDSVDGGFEIVTSTTSNSAHSIDFNSKRQYDHVNSVAIAVISISALTISQVRAGLTNTTGLNLDYAYSGFRASSSANFSINTADGSTTSVTAGSIVADTNFHSLKTECGSANIKMYVDGVLDVTKTTNRPTAKMQPVFIATNDSGTSSRTARIRYMECYNI